MFKEKTATAGTINYQPIAKLTSESRDLYAYQNLEAWAKKLCNLFDETILPQLDSPSFAQNTDIEVLVNNYTFFLAFRGEMQQSRQALEQIIAYWCKQYQISNNSDCLLKMLQPSINLSRLFLLNNDFPGFWHIYKQLTGAACADLITLGSLTLDRDLLANYKFFVRNAMFKEQLKAALKQKSYHELLELENDIPETLAKSVYYREAQIISHLMLKQYPQAKSIIRGVMYRTSGIEQNVFYYRLYESYMCQGEQVAAGKILWEIVQELTLEPLDNLKDLLFAATIIKTAGLGPTAPLSQQTLAGYRQIEDEINYAQLLLWFYQNFPGDELKQELEAIYRRSHYLLLNKAIALELNLPPVQVESKWHNALTERFNRVFNCVSNK